MRQMFAGESRRARSIGRRITDARRAGDRDKEVSYRKRAEAMVARFGADAQREIEHGRRDRLRNEQAGIAGRPVAVVLRYGAGCSRGGRGRAVSRNTKGAPALARAAGVWQKGHVRRLRDFAGIVAMLGDREIDGMQAAIDGRREARARSADDRDGAAREARPRRVKT